MVKSSIPVLEVYKAMAGNKKSPFAADEALLKNLGTQTQLAGQAYEAMSKTAKPEQANIEMANSLRKDLGEKPRGWAALAAGMLEGYAHGEKRKSILDDQERLKKYNATLEKLQDVVVESGTRLAKFQKQEQIKQGLSPYVSRTLDLILEKAPQERIDLAGMDLARRYNEATGEDWQYEMGNGRGIAVVNSKTGESAILPWSALTPPELQEKVLMVDPIYQSQLLRQQQMEDREMGLQERNVAANELRAKNAGKEDDTHKAEEMERQTYLRLQDLLQQGDPTIGTGTQTAEWMGEHFPMGSPLTAEQQEYRQLLSDLKGQRFKKFGYRNEAEFKNIQTLPENLSKDQALKLVQSELGKLGGSNASTVGKTQSDQTGNGDVDNLKVKVKLPPAIAKRFGQEVVPMSLEDAEEAVKNGKGEIID